MFSSSPMKQFPRSQDSGGSAVAARSATMQASDQTTIAPNAARGNAEARRYELARPRGMWVLIDVLTGLQRPYGICTKQQAIRRAATFLRSRPGQSCLVICSKNGEARSERTYHGEEPDAFPHKH